MSDELDYLFSTSSELAQDLDQLLQAYNYNLVL